MSSSNDNNANAPWKDAFPEYDWGNKDEPEPFHPLDEKKSRHTTTQLEEQFPTPAATTSTSKTTQKQRTGGRSLKEGDLIQKGQEIALVNVPISTMVSYTLIRNPMLGTSLLGMFGSYGALFHSLLARAPAKNTFYWGNVCVAWKLAIIAVVYTRGIQSHGKPGGGIYREYVQVREDY